MLQSIAPFTPFLFNAAMVIKVATVTSIGIMLPHVASPKRLNEARVTQVAELFTIIPAS